MDLREAKELFFRYDGSRFFMSRDGVEAEYLGAKVPARVEAEWLTELKRAKLHLLSRAGDWTALSFFLHHADFGHLAEAVRADPNGPLWPRCVFLGQLLDYASGARRTGCDPSLVSGAVRKVIADAERLLSRARSEGSIGRIEELLIRARRDLGETLEPRRG